MLECRYLIIGGGQTGLMLAKHLGKMGLPTILVEQGEVGGTYLHTSDKPKELLIRESAVFGDSLMLFKDYPTTFNTLLKHRKKLPSQLAAKRQAVIQSELEELKQYPSLQILKGWAELTSKSLAEVNSDTERHLINFQEAFVCVGRNTMVKPKIKGLEKVKFLHQQEIYLLQDIPASLAIVGVDAQTLEVADIYSKLGIKVYMLEKKDTQRCLTDLDRTGLNFLYKKLLTRQVDIKFRCEVIKVQTKKDIIQLVLGDGQTLEVSHLFAPAKEHFVDEHLGLARLGIKSDANGIQTDPSGRCQGMKHIYALGGCAAISNDQNKLSLILNQIERIKKSTQPTSGKPIGIIPGSIGVAPSREYKATAFHSSSIGNQLICIGLSEKDAKAQYGPQIEVDMVTSRIYDGFLKIIYKRPTDSLAGLVICGDLAGKLKTAGIIAMEKRMSRKDFLVSLSEDV